MVTTKVIIQQWCSPWAAHLGRPNSSCSCWYSWSTTWTGGVLGAAMEPLHQNNKIKDKYTYTYIYGIYGYIMIYIYGKRFIESLYEFLLFWCWFTVRSFFFRGQTGRDLPDWCPTFTNDNGSVAVWPIFSVEQWELNRSQNAVSITINASRSAGGGGSNHINMINQQCTGRGWGRCPSKQGDEPTS